jgi:pimeloyl-ACP methyl ester carboxylesterase
MFDAQVEALKSQYRCITFDFRGHGDSEVGRDGSQVSMLSQDVVELIRKLECNPCHIIGFSMGGFVALRLAIQRPDLLRSLILVDTTANPMPKGEIFQFRLLGFMARWIGFRSILNQVMPLMFSDLFLNDPEKIDLRDKWKQYILKNNRKGAALAVKGVISRDGVFGHLDTISMPSLIIVGDQDKLVDPQDSMKMHEKISKSNFYIIPNAGHMTPVESPEAVNTAILDFLDKA